jgi:hypothetical protein
MLGHVDQCAALKRHSSCIVCNQAQGPIPYLRARVIPDGAG